jgi:hypothetical protein
MGTKAIPDDIRQRVDDIVARFNRKTFRDSDLRYVPRYKKGVYLYLDRCDFGEPSPICRLRYTGKLEEWEFAIYKYSDGRYDPEEWMFPGSEHIDGTIEGALRAGLKAYPP